MKRIHPAIQFWNRWEKNFVESCHNVSDLDRGRLIAAYCAIGYVFRPKAPSTKRAQLFRLAEVDVQLSSVSPFEIMRSFPVTGIYDNYRSQYGFLPMRRMHKVTEACGIGIDINKMLTRYLGMNLREFKANIKSVINETHQLTTEQLAHEEGRLYA